MALIFPLLCSVPSCPAPTSVSIHRRTWIKQYIYEKQLICEVYVWKEALQKGHYQNQNQIQSFFNHERERNLLYSLETRYPNVKFLYLLTRLRIAIQQAYVHTCLDLKEIWPTQFSKLNLSPREGSFVGIRYRLLGISSSSSSSSCRGESARHPYTLTHVQEVIEEVLNFVDNHQVLFRPCYSLFLRLSDIYILLLSIFFEDDQVALMFYVLKRLFQLVRHQQTHPHLFLHVWIQNQHWLECFNIAYILFWYKTHVPAVRLIQEFVFSLGLQHEPQWILSLSPSKYPGVCYSELDMYAIFLARCVLNWCAFGCLKYAYQQTRQIGSFHSKASIQLLVSSLGLQNKQVHAQFPYMLLRWKVALVRSKLLDFLLPLYFHIQQHLPAHTEECKDLIPVLHFWIRNMHVQKIAIRMRKLGLMLKLFQIESVLDPMQARDLFIRVVPTLIVYARAHLSSSSSSSISQRQRQRQGLPIDSPKLEREKMIQRFCVFNWLRSWVMFELKEHQTTFYDSYASFTQISQMIMRMCLRLNPLSFSAVASDRIQLLTQLQYTEAFSHACALFFSEMSVWIHNLPCQETRTYMAHVEETILSSDLFVEHLSSSFSSFEWKSHRIHFHLNMMVQVLYWGRHYPISYTTQKLLTVLSRSTYNSQWEEGWAFWLFCSQLDLDERKAYLLQAISALQQATQPSGSSHDHRPSSGIFHTGLPLRCASVQLEMEESLSQYMNQCKQSLTHPSGVNYSSFLGLSENDTDLEGESGYEDKSFSWGDEWILYMLMLQCEFTSGRLFRQQTYQIKHRAESLTLMDYSFLHASPNPLPYQPEQKDLELEDVWTEFIKYVLRPIFLYQKQRHKGNIRSLPGPMGFLWKFFRSQLFLNTSLTQSEFVQVASQNIMKRVQEYELSHTSCGDIRYQSFFASPVDPPSSACQCNVNLHDLDIDAQLNIHLNQHANPSFRSVPFCTVPEQSELILTLLIAYVYIQNLCNRALLDWFQTFHQEKGIERKDLPSFQFTFPSSSSFSSSFSSLSLPSDYEFNQEDDTIRIQHEVHHKIHKRLSQQSSSSSFEFASLTPILQLHQFEQHQFLDHIGRYTIRGLSQIALKMYAPYSFCKPVQASSLHPSSPRIRINSYTPSLSISDFPKAMCFCSHMCSYSNDSFQSRSRYIEHEETETEQPQRHFRQVDFLKTFQKHLFYFI